jgi:hypothetical protein
MDPSHVLGCANPVNIIVRFGRSSTPTTLLSTRRKCGHIRLAFPSPTTIMPRRPLNFNRALELSLPRRRQRKRKRRKRSPLRSLSKNPPLLVVASVAGLVRSSQIRRLPLRPPKKIPLRRRKPGRVQPESQLQLGNSQAQLLNRSDLRRSARAKLAVKTKTSGLIPEDHRKIAVMI